MENCKVIKINIIGVSFCAAVGAVLGVKFTNYACDKFKNIIKKSDKKDK